MPADYDILEPESAPAADFDVLEPEVETPSVSPPFSSYALEGLKNTGRTLLQLPMDVFNLPETVSRAAGQFSVEGFRSVPQIVPQAPPTIQWGKPVVPPETLFVEPTVERTAEALGLDPAGEPARDLTAGLRILKGVGEFGLTPEGLLSLGIAPAAKLAGAAPEALALIGRSLKSIFGGVGAAGLPEASRQAGSFVPGQPLPLGVPVEEPVVAKLNMLLQGGMGLLPGIPERSLLKGAPNAIPIRSPETLPLRPPAEAGGAVVEGIPAPGAPPGEGPIGAVAEVRPSGTAPGGGGQAPPGTPPVEPATPVPVPVKPAPPAKPVTPPVGTAPTVAAVPDVTPRGKVFVVDESHVPVTSRPLPAIRFSPNEIVVDPAAVAHPEMRLSEEQHRKVVLAKDDPAGWIYEGKFLTREQLAAQAVPVPTTAKPVAEAPAAKEPWKMTPEERTIYERQRREDSESFASFIAPQKSADLEVELRHDGWNVVGVSARGKLVDHVEVFYRGKKVSEADTTVEAWKKVMDGEVPVPSEAELPWTLPRTAGSVSRGEPVDASAFEAFRTVLEEHGWTRDKFGNYIKEGNQYVYKSETKPPTTPPSPTAAPVEAKAVPASVGDRLLVRFGESNRQYSRQKKAFASAGIELRDAGSYTLGSKARSGIIPDTPEARQLAKQMGITIARNQWEHLKAKPPSAEPPVTPPEGGVGSVGAGAMSPKEAELRTSNALRGEGPPGTKPPVAIPAGDMPTPVVARQNRDFTIFNNANSPQFTFWFGKLGEAAKAAWQRMALGESTIRASVGRDIRRYVTGVLASVPRAFRAKGGKAFYDLLDGRKLEDIEVEWTGKPGGDLVINAAREVKTRLEEIRTTIRDTDRSSYHDALMGMKKDTLEDLFRKNVSEVADTSQFTKESFADALVRSELGDDWGIADGSYLPRIFSGNWRLTAKLPGSETSTFVTRTKTPAEAKARLYQYVKDNPEFAKADWSIAQDSVIPADMIRLGDRRFWKLVGDMKKQSEQEFDPKAVLQGIIGRKAAKQKWFGSRQRRMGFQGYSHDFQQTLSTYLHGFHRWKELSAVQKEVQPLIEQVRAENRPAAAAELETILEHLWGKPAKSTMQFDNFIRRIPVLRDYIKPLALDRWSRNTRNLVSAGTLTTLRFALVNRLQPLQGLYPLVGERIMAEAKIAQHTKAGKALLDEGGVTFDPGQYSLEKSSVGKFGRFREKLSGEHSNQEIAFLAMFQHGTEQGLAKPAAIQYAKLRGQLMTQFTPLLTDTPPVLRGPFTSLFFQFKRFPIKQLELMGRMTADKNVFGLARWFGTIALMGGAQYFLRQFLVPNSVRKEVHDALVNELGEGGAKVAMYGLPGLIGADISGSLTLGDEPFGQNLYEKIGRQLTGPGVSLAYETAKTVMTPRREAVKPVEELGTALRRYPSLRPLAEVIALARGDVDLHTPDGEIRYRRTVGDAIRGLGSLRSTSESDVAIYTNWMLEVSKEIQDLKNGLYVASSREGGDTTKALETIEKFNARWPEFAIRPDEAREYMKYRSKGSGKTDVQRRAGRRFRSALSEIEQEE